MIINLLVIGFTLFGVKEILFKHNGIESSLHWIIMAFVLGYRTFEPFPGIRLHPIEILVYATIIRIIISGAIKYRKMPIAVTVLSIFYVTFFLIDLLTRYNLSAVNEFKNAFLLTLVFLITQYIHLLILQILLDMYPKCHGKHIVKELCLHCTKNLNDQMF